jgi:phage gp36-like protein
VPYATHQDLIDRAGEKELRQVADRDRDGDADQDVLDAALADADNVIDGYLASRYRLPLDPVPALVNTWAVSIARYMLFSNGRPENVEADYKDAIAALKDVVAKRISLPVGDGESALQLQSGTTIADHPAQVFTPKKLRGW